MKPPKPSIQFDDGLQRGDVRTPETRTSPGPEPRRTRAARPPVTNPTVHDRPPTLGFRIANPTLAVLRALGAFELTPEAIDAAATRQSGREDDSFEDVAEPLTLICQDLRAHRPTQLGSMVAFTILVEGMVRRRRIQALSERYVRPQTPPVIIVGWYRTGTTFLHSLLKSLPGYDFIPAYRLADPVPSMFSAARMMIGARAMNFLAPEIPVLHRVRWNSPEECWQTMVQELLMDGFTVHWELPRLRRWLKQVDRSRAYSTWARTLHFLEEDLGHALVLKDPAHMLGLPALIDAVPNARVIWTHRDPLDALGSYGSLAAAQHRLVYEKHAPKRAGRMILNEMERSLTTGLRDRHVIPDEQLVDVAYPELIGDTTGCVERMCDQFGLEFDGDAVRARIETLRQKRESGPRHRYSLAQWHLTPEQVRERLHFYSESWWTEGHG